MEFETLTVERDGHVATMTINRPEVRNALNGRAMEDLRSAALVIKHDADLRCLIITGAGDRAFVAGADIRELAGLGPVEARQFALRGQHVLDLIETMGKPVIAAVNGYALGGGCELAMACTLRIAADTASFGLPETTLGMIPGYAGTQRLARLVGKGRALDLLLTGRRIDAHEALQIGLVNRVVPAGSLLSEARALAGRLAGNAPVAMRLAIEAINRGLDLPLSDGALLEAALFGLAFSTEDMREGVAAFLDKRSATFKGK
jgi:enoyl-CoA hydratase